MEKTGLTDKIFTSTRNIDLGRKYLTVEGKTEKGRILLHDGLNGAMEAFKEAQATKEPKIILQADILYLKQEYQLCDPSDKIRLNGLGKLLIGMGDAMRSLETVNSIQKYQDAETTHSTTEGYRVKGGLPRDAFHNACKKHQESMFDSLRTALSPDEKALVRQRMENMQTAKEVYMEKQRIALGLPEGAKAQSKDDRSK